MPSILGDSLVSRSTITFPPPTKKVAFSLVLRNSVCSIISSMPVAVLDISSIVPPATPSRLMVSSADWQVQGLNSISTPPSSASLTVTSSILMAVLTKAGATRVISLALRPKLISSSQPSFLGLFSWGIERMRSLMPLSPPMLLRTQWGASLMMASSRSMHL